MISDAARNLIFLDTTLRDGDQSACGGFSIADKIRIARALDEAGIDRIETGFPASSDIDFEACSRIAAEGLSAELAVMCRAVPREIELASRALPPSSGIIHITLPVSDRLMNVKLGKTRGEILAHARSSVRLAAGFAKTLEAGAEDATRADYDYLAEYCAAVIDAGASVVNIADTAGFATPEEIEQLVRKLMISVPAFSSGRAMISVHCHNDLGLAAANTLAGIAGGATQIETTLAGIGERAGNAATEEIAAILDARRDRYACSTRTNSALLAGAARLASSTLGLDPSPFKPVIGRNVRAHASGIHQQAEVRAPGIYGTAPSGSAALPARMALTRHSGRAGIAEAARRYAGIDLSPADLVAIGAEIKRGTTGVTELLVLLHRRGLCNRPPLRCLSFHISEETNEQGVTIVNCRATVGVGAGIDTGFDAAAPRKTLEAQGSSRTRTIVTLAKQLLPAEIAESLTSRITVSVSSISSALAFSTSTGDSPLPGKTRVYLESPEFATERTGTDESRVLFDCLLDLVNTAAVREPRSGST